MKKKSVLKWIDTPLSILEISAQNVDTMLSKDDFIDLMYPLSSQKFLAFTMEFDEIKELLESYGFIQSKNDFVNEKYSFRIINLLTIELTYRGIDNKLKLPTGFYLNNIIYEQVTVENWGIKEISLYDYNRSIERLDFFKNTHNIHIIIKSYKYNHLLFNSKIKSLSLFEIAYEFNTQLVHSVSYEYNNKSYSYLTLSTILPHIFIPLNKVNDTYSLWNQKIKLSKEELSLIEMYTL